MLSLLTGTMPLEQSKIINQVIQTVQVQPKDEPQTIQHKVVEGDTLTKIAEQYQTTWVRLWNKNTSLTNQDALNIGDTINIPSADEVLPDRPLYSIPVTMPQVGQSTYTSAVRGSGGGYTVGYCTAYAWSRRPDLPGNLGNADTWTSRASAQGYATGLTPQANAIGQYGMHVVYVTNVNSDGTFNLTEMNYIGWNKISSRANVSPSGWSFIY